MATITLPSSPAPNGARPFLLDFGTVLRPANGGPTQRINRLGMRFGVQVTLPPLRSDGEGLTVISRLLQARAQELLLDCPMIDGIWSSAGTAPRVKVDVAGGTTLQMKGLVAGYALAEGRFFSIIHSARRYLHLAAAATTADGAGDATVSVWPPMRTNFAADDVIEIDAPKMQGHVVDDQTGWQMALARRSTLSFTVHETR